MGSLRRRIGDYTLHARGDDGCWPVSYWVPDAEGGAMRRRTRLGSTLSKPEAEAEAKRLAKDRARAGVRKQEGPGSYLVPQLVEAFQHRAGRAPSAETAYHLQGSLMQWLAFWVDTRVHGWRPRPEAPVAVHPVSTYGRTREDRWQALQTAAGKLRSLASSVGAKDADAFLSWLGQQVAAATANSTVKEVRGLFAALVRWRALERSPFEDMQLFDRKRMTPGARLDPRRRKGFTDEEELSIFTALWGTDPLPRVASPALHEELAIYAELLCRTGHRADQVYRMTWDPKARRLHFHGQKGGPDSTLPATPAVAALLLRWQALTGSRWSFALDWYLHRLGWVNEQLGITGPARAHGWRHTMVRRVVNLAGHDWARKVVGHSLSAEGMSGEYFEADQGTEKRVLQILESIRHPRPPVCTWTQQDAIAAQVPDSLGP